jgi:hypothetical protein
MIFNRIFFIGAVSVTPSLSVSAQATRTCVSLISSRTVLSVRNGVFRGCGSSLGQGLAAGLES